MEIKVLLEGKLIIPGYLGDTHIEQLVLNELHKDMRMYSQRMSDKATRIIKNKIRLKLYEERV